MFDTGNMFADSVIQDLLDPHLKTFEINFNSNIYSFDIATKTFSKKS